MSAAQKVDKSISKALFDAEDDMHYVRDYAFVLNTMLEEAGGRSEEQCEAMHVIVSHLLVLGTNLRRHFNELHSIAHPRQPE